MLKPEPARPSLRVISIPATLPCIASIGLITGAKDISSLFTEETAPVKSRFFTLPKPITTISLSPVVDSLNTIFILFSSLTATSLVVYPK